METGNTNFKNIGLIRLEIKPESTAPDTDALTARPSELLNTYIAKWCNWKLVSKEPQYFQLLVAVLPVFVQ